MKSTKTLKSLVVALTLFTLVKSDCQSMFAGLKCRTTSEDPTKVDAGAVSSTRTWLCNGYPSMCAAINSGGSYSGCNTVEQVSYAMSQYYAVYGPSQGAGACNFGGIGVLSSTTANTTVTTAASSSNNICQTMFSQLKCRTSSENPSEIDAGAVSSTKAWLCSSFPSMCTSINSGGTYSSCNTVEQLSYAMSQYYAVYGPSQGAGACYFSGIGVLSSTSVNATVTAAVASTTVAASTATTCQTMFSQLKCRTSSEDSSQVDANAVSSTRTWICNGFASMCQGINSGGAYSGCNTVEQVSYAMNQYYAVYGPSQGTNACNFNGLGVVTGSTIAAVVNPTPSPSQNVVSKAGLAWPINQFNDGTNPSLGPWAQGKISWIYTWSDDYSPLPVANSGLEWVPQLHSQSGVSSFLGKINSGAYDKISNILLFNEPDLNYPPYAYAVDVNTAIASTIQVFQALRSRGISPRVGTPAMSYNIGWLQQYMSGVKSQCSYCTFSFVPVHCYTLDANSFMGTVQNYRNTFGLPIWVTEFADTDFNSRTWQMSASDVQNFMSTTTNWLNSQTWVERYSWFGVMRAVDVQDKANMVMNWDGSRTSLGDQYVLRGGANA